MRGVGSASGRLARWEAERAELRGLGILQPLLDEPGLTDIYVNAPGEIWTDGAQGLRRRDLAFPDDDAVRELAVRLITLAGRRLDTSHPCADVQTAAGYRVHAVLPPVAPEHPLLSIRLQPEHRPDFAQLCASGLCEEATARLLRRIVAARVSFLVSGSTGSGKTTLLNALLGLCPARERLVLIEDSAELRPEHPHVVSLQTRQPNAEGAGGIGLTALIREALRMGPDRLVLGECRGEELKDLLLALNTGHEGGGGTLHANSAQAVPSRLLALGALAGLAPEAVRRQVLTGLGAVIHLERGSRGRRVREIGVFRDDRLPGALPGPDDVGRGPVTGGAAGASGGEGLSVCPAWICPEDDAAHPGPGLPALRRLLRLGQAPGEETR